MQDSQKADKYIKLQKIAEGSYGAVIKCRNAKTHQIVAIKKFKNVSKQGLPVSGVREIQIMNLLKHQEKLLKLIEVFQRKGQVLMVIQWMDKSLNQIIQGPTPYNTKLLFRQIVENVKIIHDNCILHRDLKPQNIMLKIDSQKPIVKVVDFGMAKQDDFSNNKLTNQVGSLYYRAPQLLLGTRKYSYQIDVWSLGCIFYELLTRKIFFKGKNQLEQIVLIIKLLNHPKENEHPIVYKLFKKYFEKQKQDQSDSSISDNWNEFIGKFQIEENALDLLKKFIQLEPSSRITLQQALNHPYLSIQI